MRSIAGVLVATEHATCVRAAVAEAATRTGAAHALCEGEGFALAQLGDTQVARSECGRHLVALQGRLEGLAALCARFRIRERAGQHAVLADLLAQRGTTVLPELRGAFAFAWVDTKARIAVLARDRFGRSPLLLRETRRGLRFASRIDLLVDELPELDASAVAAFLAYGGALGERSLCQGARELAPGSCLEIDLESGNQATRTFARWELPSDDESRSARNELELELAERLQRAVDLAVGESRTVGIALSGGLDSSILTGLVRRRDRELRAYHLGFDALGPNEAAQARLVAGHAGVELHEVVLSAAEFFEAWRGRESTSALPPADAAELAFGLLAQRAAEREECLLTGHGAAELFGGHGAVLRSAEDQALLERLAAEPQLAKEPTLARFAARARQVYGRPLPKDVRRFFERRYAGVPAERRDELLAPGFLARARGLDEIAGPLLRCLDANAGHAGGMRFLQCYRQVHLPLVAEGLARVVAQAGLQLAAPFLDEDLACFAQRLPFDCLLRWRGELERRAAASECADDVCERFDQDRVLLRATYAAQLPRRCPQRRHVPLVVPLDEWLTQGSGRDFVHDVLLDPVTRDRGIFAGPALERLLAELDQELTRGARILLAFRAVSLELWCRQLQRTIGARKSVASPNGRLAPSGV